MDAQPERIIGRHTGVEQGPLVIALGGMHGNEPAGVRALDMVFHMLHVEPHKNPDFQFKGRLVGICGNLQAYARGLRYITKDLNRQFLPEIVNQVRALPKEKLRAEDLELREIIDLVHQEIEDYQPKEVIVLDLHTTSAKGGIFTIATDDPKSIRVAKEMHAPVITGMLQGIHGTTLHYFRDKNLPVPTVAITFEAGHHEDPLSTRRAIAAIISLLRSVGCVLPRDVENRHDKLLTSYSNGLPTLAHMICVHHVKPEDGFRMKGYYENFQPIKKGEVIAYDRNGPIKADWNGHILMPLYQPQGNDGFFLIKILEN